MKWLKLGNDIINLAHIALVEREGEKRVSVHLALPTGDNTGHVVKNYDFHTWETAFSRLD
jgi:hypothetical protein